MALCSTMYETSLDSKPGCWGEQFSGSN